MRHVAVLNNVECETMKTYPIIVKDGSRVFAFEVENIYVSLAAVVRLVSEVDGVTDVAPRSMFSKSSDIHVQFKFHGQPYIVWEPYGDSSRYWIGPKEEVNDVGDIAVLENVFIHYRPPLYRSLLGDVLTFRFVTRFLDSGRHTQ